jgi:D-glycero-beta-D-manno-heptose-7-phosphate kinase
VQNELRLSPDEKERLADAISRFPGCRILIAGDMMLDVFIWGEVNRISPEAPVPVVEVHEETRLLGGTANVVHNVAALGAKVLVTGVIGDDFAGRELLRLFDQVAIPTNGLVIEQHRPTTVKTRIIAQSQQVVRCDRERRGPVENGSMERILATIRENLPNIDGMIVSDYAKGVVAPEFMDAIRSLDVAARVPVVVDPKVEHIDLYRNVTMITPNHHEAARMAGIKIRDEASLVAAGRVLLDQLQCETVLITRGKEGMSLFHRDGQVKHIPTVARRVYDVTGAGDTVIAAVTLGIVAGLTIGEAAVLANLAAGIVVGEVGTATVTSNQLAAAVGRQP